MAKKKKSKAIKKSTRRPSAATQAPSAKSSSGSSRLSGAFNSDLSRIEALLKMMSEHGLAEFEWEKGSERFAFKTPQGSASSIPMAVAAPTPHPVSPVPSTSSSVDSNGAGNGINPRPDNQKEVLSPFVGTFYRSARPGADPFVKENQAIKSGDVLCIIEAMKLMNEIESEMSGRVVSILVENGQPVEYGEPLFVVET